MAATTIHKTGKDPRGGVRTFLNARYAAARIAEVAAKTADARLSARLFVKALFRDPILIVFELAGSGPVGSSFIDENQRLMIAKDLAILDASGNHRAARLGAH
jgi:hypothetical protein